MTLPSGKILTAGITRDAEGDTWGGFIEFTPEVMPMELSDGLHALAHLILIAKKTMRDMIKESEELMALGIDMDTPHPKGKGN